MLSKTVINTAIAVFVANLAYDFAMKNTPLGDIV
jgi:hypothetical protein